MLKNLIIAVCTAVGLFAFVENAEATCRGKFNLEFGYTNEMQFSMQSNSTCQILMEFDYVALYGLSVRQQPKNGSVKIVNHYTFVYTPRKGYKGQDTFILDAEGGRVNFETGTATMRSKAGMAFTMTVQ
jgi:Bacterial Ig domain